MSQAVNIVINVVEQMNLSNEDRLLLIDKLGQGVTASKPVEIKKMSEKEVYRRRFERWMVETKKLYPPKK